jgi:hypothetical protein
MPEARKKWLRYSCPVFNYFAQLYPTLEFLIRFFNFHSNSICGSHTAACRLFPSFLALSETCSNSCRIFCLLLTSSGKFPHPSARCACVDTLPWNVFPLLAVYINEHSLDLSLIFYCAFKHAACQLFGTHCQYFLVGSEGNSTKEYLRRSLQFIMWEAAGRGNEIEGFYYGRWVPIHWINSRGRPIRAGPSGWDWVEALLTPHRKILPCNKPLINA